MIRGILYFRRPQDDVVAGASSGEQRARVLALVKAPRYARPPLRGVDSLDEGSAHASSRLALADDAQSRGPTCCGGRRTVQKDALSRDR